MIFNTCLYKWSDIKGGPGFLREPGLAIDNVMRLQLQCSIDLYVFSSTLRRVLFEYIVEGFIQYVHIGANDLLKSNYVSITSRGIHSRIIAAPKMSEILF